MFGMASWTEIRHRRQVRIAFFKGKPIASEDYETVRKMLDAVPWYRPLAVFCGAVACFGFCVAVIGPGYRHLGWSSLLNVFTMGVLTWTLLRQRKRILYGASKMSLDAS
jgi:hypothetical protein